MQGRIVIRNGIVAPQGAGATVVVEGRRLAEVAPPGRRVEGRPGDWDVDADGRLVVAGGIDAHAHLALGALQRLAGLPGRPPPTVSDLRAGLRGRMERRATPERVAALARAGAVAALRAGVTCVFDQLRAAPGSAPEALDALAGACALGPRAVLAYGARGPAGTEEVRASAAFAERHADDARLRGAVGVSGLHDTDDDTLAAAASHAARAGAQVCLGEDESDLAHAFARFGRRPVEVLSAHGLLGPRTIVAHGGTTVHAEAVLLADARSTLVVAPRSAMFFGAALPPLLDFASVGLSMAFGTDGLFPDVAGEALHAATMLRHAQRDASAAAGLVGRVAWPAAAGLASEFFGESLGRLEPGALADVVVLDWRPAVPLPDLPAGDLALLWAGAPAAWAIVDGEVRLREGRLLGADEAEIAAAAREAARAVLDPT
ncbi:amidohydrolase family protein [Anaeromyxobacter sp. Fw109-5]|uniref:amidohydrolase family protein n=1 Tax=Anaeromyxobacter sp. (strain Fw109-5) TaxID=404589 RepID=UPI0000ED6E25|nr:amidohydrolase family protein [Anaeromyxobacter sp. Fw109-5]